MATDNVSETADTLLADTADLVAPATEPLGEPTGDAFVLCNGCGRESRPAATEEESLANAISDGWFMSEHEPPLPYCAMHKPVDRGPLGRRFGRTGGLAGA